MIAIDDMFRQPVAQALGWALLQFVWQGALLEPGGDFALPGNAVCQKPRFPTGVVNQFCWVLDMVMAPCRGTGASNGTYCWAAGTSMAGTPVAA